MQTASLKRLYHQTASLKRLYRQSASMKNLYHQTARLKRLYHQTASLKRLYHQTVSMKRLYHKTTSLFILRWTKRTKFYQDSFSVITLVTLLIIQKITNKKMNHINANWWINFFTLPVLSRVFPNVSERIRNSINRCVPEHACDSVLWCHAWGYESMWFSIMMPCVGLREHVIQYYDAMRGVTRACDSVLWCHAWGYESMWFSITMPCVGLREHVIQYYDAMRGVTRACDSKINAVILDVQNMLTVVIVFSWWDRPIQTRYVNMR